MECGLVKNPQDGVKILANGELTKKLTVKANAFKMCIRDRCYANKGPTMKRVKPRAQGRAYRIEKRMSHITIVLNER